MDYPFPTLAYRCGEWLLSTDRSLLDLDLIFDYLSRQSYWAKGRRRDIVARSLAHSYCFGVYNTAQPTSRQVGLGRVVTDFATYGYLCDVFILPSDQGQSLGKWLVQTIVTDPNLQGLSRLVLDTADAHDLYAQFGFIPNPTPEKQMLFRPNS